MRLPDRVVPFMSPVLLAIPIMLAVWWGNFPSDHAYLLLLQENIFLGNQPQPLFIQLLKLFSASNAPLVALGLTALGWSVAALALWRLISEKANAHNAALLGLLTLLLFVLHPVQFNSQLTGSGLSWAVAFGLWLLALQSKAPDWLLALMVVGLFVTWLDWSSAVLVWLVLGWRLLARQRFLPITTLIVVLGSVATVWMAMRNGIGVDVGGISAEISTSLNQYLFESDLYWLALPCLIAGLWASRREPNLLIFLAWSALLLLCSSLLGQIAFAAFIIWLIALGLAKMMAWLSAQEHVTVDKRLPLLGLSTLVISLSIACVLSLRYRHQLRPVARFAAEDATLEFLRSSTIPHESYAASARLAYLLDTPTYVWQESVGDDAMALVANPPDVLLMPVSLWERQLSNALWVRQRYTPIERVSASGTATSSNVSSGLSTSLGGASEQTEIRVFRKFNRLSDDVAALLTPITTTFGLHLDSTALAPSSISPGGTLDVLLNWRATATITPFGTVLNVTNPLDGTPYAQIDQITPNNLSNDWIEAGQLVPTYYQMTLVPDIPVGAYPVTLQLHKADFLTPEPILRAGETNTLDRSILAYVAVPWEGEPSGEPVNASYADGIELRSVEINGEAVSNGSISLRLFWQTTQTPAQNYTIFVHFLDEAGQFITGADGVPFGGRYPTRGWHPGDTIPSDHLLTLPDNLPSGSYQIKTGLYLPSTGDRLLATAADGTQPPDFSILLKQLDSR